MYMHHVIGYTFQHAKGCIMFFAVLIHSCNHVASMLVATAGAMIPSSCDMTLP